jgi:hypothetical protein
MSTDKCHSALILKSQYLKYDIPKLVDQDANARVCTEFDKALLVADGKPTTDMIHCNRTTEQQECIYWHLWMQGALSTRFQGRIQKRSITFVPSLRKILVVAYLWK